MLLLLLFPALLLWPIPSAHAEEGAKPREVDLKAGQWIALPGEVRPEELPRQMIVIDGPVSDPVPPLGPAYSVRDAANAVAFVVTGDMPHRRTMHWSRRLTGTDLPILGYCTFRYRATGIRRNYGPLTRGVR